SAERYTFALATLSFVTIPRPPGATTFPYTTLFRSADAVLPDLIAAAAQGDAQAREAAAVLEGWDRRVEPDRAGATLFLLWLMERSEEHTSELQSRENLVCRLLL